METIPAIEDTSPIRFPSPADGRGGHTRSTIRDQLEAAQFAQQMYHQSEIQKFEGVIQTLVAEMREMKQEDEGSEIRIQELERQRDTACLAMRHMNRVIQEMRNDFESAMTRINGTKSIISSPKNSLNDYIKNETRRLSTSCSWKKEHKETVLPWPESMKGLLPNFTNGQERIFNFAQVWQIQNIS